MHNPGGPRHGYQPHKNSGTGHASAVTAETTKDSPTRSLLKAITYRLFGSGAMFIISFLLLRNFTQDSLTENLGNATLISVVDFVAKLAFYYGHERVWTNISWGKYWHKHHWESRAWKRKFHKTHK